MDGLLALWIVFTVMALGAIAAVIVWAVRSGQFRDQDHARRLPLEAELKTGPEAERKSCSN